MLTQLRWLVILNGLAVVTLEDNSSVSLTASMGESSLLFIADTPDVSEKGHNGYFPGITETIFMQIPTQDGLIPKHEPIYEDAPCSAHEFTGLRGWAT